MLAVSLLLAAQVAHPSFSVEVKGKGSPIVLIPGLASSGAVWDSAVARWQGAHELHVVTLSGFAGRPAIDAPLVATARKELAAYLRTLDKPVLVGHSLGGALALALAADDSKAVTKVVAVDGLPFMPALQDAAATAESVRPMAEGMKAQLVMLDASKFAAQNRMMVAAMVTDPKAQDVVASWGARSSQRAVAEAMAELMETDLRPLMSKVQAPLLLVAAGAFAATPEARAALSAQYEAQIAAVPDHRVWVDAQARHFVMLDDAQGLYARIETFLAEGK